MELGLVLDMAAEDGPDRVAIVDVVDATLTRGELRNAARRAAARFLRAGAQRVGYLAPNGRALPVALFGAALAGIPFVPFNHRLPDDQLGDLMARLPDLLVVTTTDGAQRLRRGAVMSIVLDTDLLDDLSEAPAGPAVDPETVAILLYTSGTTAAPKAAVLRHRHLTSYIVGTVEFGAADTDEAVIVSVPPFHIAGVSAVLSNLYFGRRLVYLDPFDAGRWLQTVRRHAVTHAMVVPTMLARIGAEVGDAEADVASLRTVAYGGAAMPGPVIERALRQFPAVGFTNAYGLTETSSTIALLGPQDHRTAIDSDDPDVRARLHSVGRPLPGVEIKIVDADGQPCPTGVVGDVLVRGDQVSGEYLDVSPPSDADDQGGAWFATRDRGYLDGDGFLFIEGRSDDTIIRGGENIGPAEIEDVLLSHPSILECAVVGLPDPEWGHRIAAAVVLRPGDAVEPEAVRAWVKAKLGSLKTPELVEVRPDLPYTDSGKLLRRQVRSSFAGTTAPPPGETSS